MPLTIDNPTALETSLIKHEGVRLMPYTDTTGNLSIGIGHNLTANGISHNTAETILTEDIAKAVSRTDTLLPWVASLDDVRKRAFVEMVFNLDSRLLGFHHALDAAQAGDWSTCVAELKASRWATQVGHRAVDLESMILTGTDLA
jgi:lysozyme